MDDTVAVVKNDDLRSELTTWKELFENDYWGTNVSAEESHKSYRPFTVLTFRLNYYYGELEPFGYHIVNVFLHGICTFLILMYTKQNQSILLIIDDDDEKVNEEDDDDNNNNNNNNNKNNSKSYLWVGMLFASHPIHTEAISSIVGRAEPLSCIFVLIGLIIYTPRTNRSSMINVIFICILSFISMLCKETGAMLIIVCCLFDCFDWIVTVTLYKKKTIGKIYWINSFVFILFFILTIYFRLYITSTNFSPTFSDVDNYIHYIENPINRILTYGYLHVKYVLQLTFPMYLSCDWSFEAFPPISSIFDVRNIITFSMYFTIIGIMFIYIGLCKNEYIYNKNKDDESKQSVILYPIILGIIFFLPASNIFFPVATVLAERILYLPSIGFCIILPNIISIIIRMMTRKRNIGNIQTITIKHSLLITICLFYTYKTFTRNDDWNTPLKLFKSATEIVPKSCKAWVCLATAYKDMGDYDKARIMVEKSLKIKPDFAGGYYLLGQMEEELYVTFYFPNNRKIDVLSNISLIHMLRFVEETKMEPFIIMN